MLFDIAMESLMNMDDDELDYALESMSDEELDMVDAAMEELRGIRARMAKTGAGRAWLNFAGYSEDISKSLADGAYDDMIRDIDEMRKASSDINLSELKARMKMNDSLYGKVSSEIKRLRAEKDPGNNEDIQELKRVLNHLNLSNKSLKYAYAAGNNATGMSTDRMRERAQNLADAVYGRNIRSVSSRLSKSLPAVLTKKR